MKQDQWRRIHATRRSVIGQFALLGAFINRWYSCRELHYENPEELEDKYNELIELFMGSMNHPGLLQEIINREMDGILEGLHADMPQFKPEELLIFSYCVAGFSNQLISYLTGISVEYIRVIKTRMKYSITLNNCPRKKEYLAMIPGNSCRFGKDMLSL